MMKWIQKNFDRLATALLALGTCLSLMFSLAAKNAAGEAQLANNGQEIAQLRSRLERTEESTRLVDKRLEGIAHDVAFLVQHQRDADAKGNR
jgi:septal ring factor EnvC (AmiA/AmiB activator)